MKCTCPNSSVLTTIAHSKCGEDFGQAQYIIFQKLYNESSENKIALTDGSVALSTITSLLSASDDTKITVSPLLYNPSTTPGDAKTWGGGNATPDGVTYFMNTDGTTFAAELRRAEQKSVKAMKELICFAEGQNLGCYILDNNGMLKGGKRVTTTGSPATDDLYPIPVKDLFVGDLNMAGLDEPDYNSFSMSFPGNWSDESVNVPSVTPAELLAKCIAVENA